MLQLDSEPVAGTVDATTLFPLVSIAPWNGRFTSLKTKQSAQVECLLMTTAWQLLSWKKTKMVKMTTGERDFHSKIPFPLPILTECADFACTINSAGSTYFLTKHGALNTFCPAKEKGAGHSTFRLTVEEDSHALGTDSCVTATWRSRRCGHPGRQTRKRCEHRTGCTWHSMPA